MRRGEPANLEKAIEIKRRAQRCIQNGDLDGALAEYEKLVDAQDSDPYNYVLLADLLFKKGEQPGAAERYLAAVQAYQSASLYKNAIAVCKKMVRLSLTPAKVLRSLAELHALDGLASESALYYVQYAEHLMRSNAPAEAAAALRQAFDVSQDNIRVLEQLGEAWLLAGEEAKGAQAFDEASRHYRHAGAAAQARRSGERAKSIATRAGIRIEDIQAQEPATASGPAHAPEPGAVELHAPGAPAAPEAAGEAPSASDPTTPSPAAHVPLAEVPRAETSRDDAPARVRLDGLESGRHHAPAAPEAELAEAEATATEPDESPVYEIADEPATGTPGYEQPLDDPGVPPGAEASDDAHEFVIDEPADESPVYEIPADDEAGVASGPAAAEPEPDAAGVYEIDAADEPVAPARPASPPAAAHAPAPASAHGPGPVVPTSEDIALAHVEELLVRAQHQFRAGERADASATLAEAAQTCESIGRSDNAAIIYRSLGRGPHATPELLRAWLANCERRGATQEAGQVLCELGDRALNDGDQDAARASFQRALALDPTNETAIRRMHRFEMGVIEAAEPAEPAAVEPETAEAAPGEGRVEVAVGRAEAVTFDLGGLLAEFQRGVAEQLAGDAQSHYDLGMTYREMGLFEQAVESFHAAAQDPAFASRALEMAGRCMADEGRTSEAVEELARALALPGVTGGNDGELRYYYGLALSACGRTAEALAELELVQMRLPGFEDVDHHVAELRGQLGRAA